MDIIITNRGTGSNMNFWKWYIPDNDCTDVLTLNTKWFFFSLLMLWHFIPRDMAGERFVGHHRQYHILGVILAVCAHAYLILLSFSYLFNFMYFIFLNIHLQTYFVSPSDEISIYSGILSLLIVFMYFVYFFNFAIIFAYWFFSNDKFYML